MFPDPFSLAVNVFFQFVVPLLLRGLVEDWENVARGAFSESLELVPVLFWHAAGDSTYEVAFSRGEEGEGVFRAHLQVEGFALDDCLELLS